MTAFDIGGRDRLALAVLAQYRMATTEQMHVIVSPDVRIEQTRRRLRKLRNEGLVDRVTLPQAGRLRVWHPTAYGVQVALRWPELRGRRPPRTATNRTAVRLGVGHTLTVTETALTFLKDARKRGDLFQALDWLPEVHHPLGSGEAVIPDALMYYQRSSKDGNDAAMLRAFIEVDRATMGPERLASKLGNYARLHSYIPKTAGRRPTLELAQAEWQRRYPLFPRLLFILDGTGPTGAETRIQALHAASKGPAAAPFVRTVPVLATPMTDLRHHGPAAPIWRPVHDPVQLVSWMQ